MVSFNCDGCGDVIKKPKLDQHFHSRCHAPFTCLDCSTQFNNPGQWKSHTSCISEEAKYQKSVYKGPKGKGKNNEAQQQQQQQQQPIAHIPAPEPPKTVDPSPPTNTAEKKRKRDSEAGAEVAASAEKAKEDQEANLSVEKKKSKNNKGKSKSLENGNGIVHLKSSDKKEKKEEKSRKEKSSSSDALEPASSNGADAAPTASAQSISADLMTLAKAAGKEGKSLSALIDECVLHSSGSDRNTIVERLVSDFKVRVGKKGDLVLSPVS